MTKKERNKAILVFSLIALVFMIGSILTGGGGGEEESIQTVMRDAVMHDVNKVSLFGIKDVNPALISGFIVSGLMILFALICRIFVIPRFKLVPGKFQLVLEIDESVVYRRRREHQHLRGYACSDHVVHQAQVAVLAAFCAGELAAISEVVALVDHDEVIVAPVQSV